MNISWNQTIGDQEDIDYFYKQKEDQIEPEGEEKATKCDLDKAFIQFSLCEFRGTVWLFSRSRGLVEQYVYVLS